MTRPSGQLLPHLAVQFLRTFLIALAGILAVMVIVVAVATRLGPDYGAPRPTGAIYRGYSITYRVAGGPPTQLAVDQEAKACEALAASKLLRDTCVLAVNIDPAWIAAAAYGVLNSEDTPSYRAITLRAVLAGDPAVCARGGLLDERLTACQNAATSGAVTMADSNVSITVRRAQ